MKPSDLIRPQPVVRLAAATKAGLLRDLAAAAAQQLALPEASILVALNRREALGSTGIGDGTALPHAPVAGLGEPFGLLARLERPVAYEAIDGQPVDLVCLVLSPENGGRGVDALACVARWLRLPEVRARVRAARDGDDIRALLLEGQ